MKKLQLFIAFASLFIGIRASAQFTVNYSGCEGDTAKVYVYAPMYSGICDVNPNDFYSENYFIYEIYYPGGTYNLVSGPLGWYTTNNTMTFVPHPNTPDAYTNPGALEVRVTRYKHQISTQQMVQCGLQETYSITPKKKVTSSGPTYLDNPGIVNYSVTNVPGVNFTWNMDPDWSIVNSNSNQSNVSISIDPAGGGPFPLSVTANPQVYACGWPASWMISISPCFYQGTTVFNFCEPQYNWGNILASTDFDDYPNKYPRMKGDFNGDDKDDLIGFGHSGVIVGLSTGSSFNYNTWTSALTNGNGGYNQTERPRMVGDFNDDGKDDIIGFGYSGATVALSNGLSFSTSGFSASPYFGYDQGFTGPHLPRFVGDFDGNGKDDIMACGHSSTSVGLSNGTSFSVSGWSGGATFSTTDGGFGDPDKYPRMVGDFDGNGKTDIIGFGHTDVSVGLSNGSSFDVSTWTHSFTYGNDGILQSTTPRGVGDFDGDGMDDIILFGHSSVSVGISTGSGFNVSTWTNQNFTDAQGWSSLTLNPLAEGAKMCIYDANGDGKDDLIGFNDGVYVAYSVGDGFQCADYGDYMALGYYYSPAYRGDRFVGNFDNRDNEAEFVRLSTDYVSVMDCDNCVTSVANAAMTGHYASAPETSGSNTVTVHKYCADEPVIVDLSATTCEDSYYLEIKPYNLSTGVSGTTVYQTGWLNNNAPQSVDLSSLATLQTNQIYKLSYGVGPNPSTKILYFRINGPTANLTITPNQTRTVTNNFGTFTINQYCTNVVSFPLNGTASNCYDEYRYSIFEVAAPFFVPAYGVPPVLQIPASGGWNPGPVATQNINMSNIVSGKVYKIILYVRKNGVTSTYERLVERSSCIAPPPKSLLIEEGREWISDDPTSILYPNPATDNIIILPAGYEEEEQITGEIYDAYGKLVDRISLDSKKETSIDLLNLTKGMYIVLLNGNSRTEKLTFIKQ